MSEMQADLLAESARPRAPAPRRIEWRPAADITPHELAVAMPAVVRLTHGGLFVERIVAGLIEAMPGSVQRHFRVEPAPSPARG